MANGDRDINKALQVAIAEKLQLKLLERFEKMLDGREAITSTDLATISRLLMMNGWSIDPHKLPSGLKSVLTTKVDSSKFEDGDADIPSH